MAPRQARPAAERGTDTDDDGVTRLGPATLKRDTDPKPSDDPSDTVNLTAPGGTKVTAPARLVDALKAQGFK